VRLPAMLKTETSIKNSIMNFIIRIVITALMAYGLSMFLGGVHIPDFKDALVLAFVLALLNAFLKPILVIFTLPVTIMSLGLFLFVINGIIVLIADQLMDGVRIDGFGWALLFSLLLSIMTAFAQSLFDKKR
jgi:putative membrane protein